MQNENPTKSIDNIECGKRTPGARAQRSPQARRKRKALDLPDPLRSTREEWLVSYGYFVTRRPSRMAHARMQRAA
jgi:hypothetical protein